MSNLYYNPENYELTTVGELDFSSGSYEFDTTVVFKHADGRLFYAEDSGCSCPEPFGDVRGIPDLTPIDNLAAFDRHLQGRLGEQYGNYVSASEVREFMKTVREARA